MAADDYFRENVRDTLVDHEDRISSNEKFRLRVEGALGIIGFAIGSGFAVTLALWIIGVL